MVNFKGNFFNYKNVKGDCVVYLEFGNNVNFLVIERVVLNLVLN